MDYLRDLKMLIWKFLSYLFWGRNWAIKTWNFLLHKLFKENTKPLKNMLTDVKHTRSYTKSKIMLMYIIMNDIILYYYGVKFLYYNTLLQINDLYYI